MCINLVALIVATGSLLFTIASFVIAMKSFGVANESKKLANETLVATKKSIESAQKDAEKTVKMQYLIDCWKRATDLANRYDWSDFIISKGPGDTDFQNRKAELYAVFDMASIMGSEFDSYKSKFEKSLKDQNDVEAPHRVLKEFDNQFLEALKKYQDFFKL